MEDALEASSLDGVNKLLAAIGFSPPPFILFITGSSGCGKTFLCEAIAEHLSKERAVVRHFDSIGVPTDREMIENWGSGRAWQEAATHAWVERLTKEGGKPLIVLEGQYHPRYLIDACRIHQLTSYKLVVVSAREDVWTRRLTELRGQAELVTDDMRNWARVIREATLEMGGAVIDTSESNLKANLAEIAEIIKSGIRVRFRV